MKTITIGNQLDADKYKTNFDNYIFAGNTHFKCDFNSKGNIISKGFINSEGTIKAEGNITAVTHIKIKGTIITKGLLKSGGYLEATNKIIAGKIEVKKHIRSKFIISENIHSGGIIYCKDIHLGDFLL